MQSTRLRLVALIASGLSLPCASLAQHHFTPIGDLEGGGTFSRVWAVSGNGYWVVGASGSSDSGNLDNAFRFYRPGPGPIQSMGELPGGVFQSTATGIDQDGSAIVGTSVYGPDGRTHAFRWSSFSGVLTDLGNFSGLPPEHDISLAYAVSDNGKTIVGQGMSRTLLTPQACLWGIEQHGDRVVYCAPIWNIPGATGPNVALGVSGNGLVSVGESPTAAGVAAWRSTPVGGPVELADADGGAFACSARDASTTGSVIVGYCTTAQGREAALWHGDPSPLNLPYSLVPIGELPGGGVSAIATACTADGRVVVGASDAGRKVEPEPGVLVTATDAFIWDARHGMRKLADLLGDALPAGWFLDTASGISGDGTVIAGTGTNPAGNPEGFIVTLPKFCIADMDDNGLISVQDLFDFLVAYFNNSLLADVTMDYTVTVQDVYDFLARYFTGCA